MGTTVSVIVQSPYSLSDDEGHPLFVGGGVYKVKATDRIQNYIDLGQLSVVSEADKPAEATPEEETAEAPVKKTRVSAQKQENLDG